jgi:hypothetical protein
MAMRTSFTGLHPAGQGEGIVMRRFVMLVVAGLLAAGCGGGGSVTVGDAVTVAAPTRAEYIEAMMVSGQDGLPGGVTETDVRCVAEKLVDWIGVDALVAAGVRPDDLGFGVGGLGGFVPTEAQADGIVDINFECYDYGAIMAASFANDPSTANIPSEKAHCVGDEAEKSEAFRAGFKASYLGENIDGLSAETMGVLMATCGIDRDELASATSTPTNGVTSFEVDELGISFALDRFEADPGADPDYAFLARRAYPQALITIMGERPGSLDDIEAAGDEVVRKITIDGVEAVEITNAILGGGNQPGVSAAELAVDNGDQSFSVIMSAPTPYIDELWAVFMESLSIKPD